MAALARNKDTMSWRKANDKKHVQRQVSDDTRDRVAKQFSTMTSFFQAL